MHYTVKEIVNILWLPLVIFDVALYVLLKYTSFYAWLLGKAGEFHVKNELKKLPAHYIVLNDIMIATGDKTTQIDHIVVCPSGFFVIETKHYHGMIRGSDSYEYWRQYLGKKRFFQFYNPTRQNYGHILALSNALQLPIEKFTSIVCFTAPVKLNVQSRSQVIYLRDLLGTLAKYQDTIIDHPEAIANAIQQLNITDPQARRQHKQSLKVSHSKNYHSRHHSANVFTAIKKHLFTTIISFIVHNKYSISISCFYRIGVFAYRIGAKNYRITAICFPYTSIISTSIIGSRWMIL